MKKLSRLTRRDQIEIRGVYGQSVFDFYQQSRAILDRVAPKGRLSNFFAEPQLNPTRGEIAWFSHAVGGVRAMSELSPAERAAVLSDVDQIRQQVRHASEQFVADGGGGVGTRAEIYKAMLSATDLEQCLFLVGEQPVLCEWGCKPLRAGAGSVDLWSVGAILRVEPEIPAAIPIRRTDNDSSTPDLPTASAAVLPPSQAIPETPDESAPSEKIPVEVTPQALPQSTGVRHDTVLRSVTSPEQEVTPRLPPAPVQPKSPHDFENDVQSGDTRSGFWGFFKRAFVALLILFLLLGLIRACGNVAVLSSATSVARTEEAQLRKEVAELRAQASDLLVTCPVQR